MPSIDFLRGHLKKFHESGFQLKEHTDLTIHCQDEILYVHRIILSAQSDFFANACKSESPFKDAQTGVIQMNDDDLKLISLLLAHCYLSPSDFDRENEQSSDKNYKDIEEKGPRYIISYVSVYVIAGKYQFCGLMNDKKRDFLRYMQYYNSCPCLIRKIFDNTLQPGFHHTVLKYAAKHITYLNKSKEFKEMIDDNEDFRNQFLAYIATYKDQNRECLICNAKSFSTLYDDSDDDSNYTLTSDFQVPLSNFVNAA
ncbi:hypothetical protein BKA81DRAFT_402713 [Phyllosticta paracitricarpa]|uniref:BTB domain-containing protein n=2 Tax=Phyllosticta TaxID=121621 RepID=A0ABR1MJR8_9PEZI